MLMSHFYAKGRIWLFLLFHSSVFTLIQFGDLTKYKLIYEFLLINLTFLVSVSFISSVKHATFVLVTNNKLGSAG